MSALLHAAFHLGAFRSAVWQAKSPPAISLSLSAWPWSQICFFYFNPTSKHFHFIPALRLTLAASHPGDRSSTLRGDSLRVSLDSYDSFLPAEPTTATSLYPLLPPSCLTRINQPPTALNAQRKGSPPLKLGWRQWEQSIKSADSHPEKFTLIKSLKLKITKLKYPEFTAILKFNIVYLYCANS